MFSRLTVLLVLVQVIWGQTILTNEAVLKMVRAGLADEVVVGAIAQHEGRFSLSPDDLIALKAAGVSDRVIAAMLQKNSPGAGSGTGSPSTEPVQLPDGTPLKLRLTRNLSSADAKTGETVDFEVLEEVKVDDILVIARGASAMATVTEAQPKRRMGRGGKLNVNIDYVRLLSGEKAALRAIRETKGGGHTGAMTGGMVATAIVFFPAAPLFLFMHGKDITIPKGTEVTAYINGDINRVRLVFEIPTHWTWRKPSGGLSFYGGCRLTWQSNPPRSELSRSLTGRISTTPPGTPSVTRTPTMIRLRWPPRCRTHPAGPS
ncbi:MAG: hypothetical protein IT364_00815 [Candidatus Hydrogenedentes bacterium]|nr:hypothetical protein [Candidatus Hydrogenedentota bacterium]